MSSSREISRREFLRRTGGVAAGAGIGMAFPAAVPSRALGAPGSGPSGERVRLGFIGVKNRGGQNIAAFRKHNVDVVALCDVDRNVLAAAKAGVEKASGGSCKTYHDYRKLLEDREIDAVVISTPDHWHALQTIHACQAGKDVYCEKPLSLTVREGRAMVDAARRYRRVVQTGSQQRSDDRFRLACELVRNGRLGRLHTVKVGIPGNNFKAELVPDGDPPSELDYELWLGPAPWRPYNVNRVHYNFRFFWHYSGGQMTNFGAHHLDIAQWGLGMDAGGPLAVEGSSQLNPGVYYETPDRCRIQYTYASGVTVLCGQEFRGGATFEGEKGTIYVNRGRIEANPAELLAQPLRESDIRLYASADHYGDWLQCIRSRKQPICDVEIGHRSATVCHLGNIAVRSGRKVTWDPVREEIVGDREQSAMLHYDYRKPWTL